MYNVAVTGGAGFIGSHLVDKLIDDGYSVTIIDNLSTGNKKYINVKATFKNVDIRDYSLLSKTLKGVDYVYHLAALPRIQRSIQDPRETNEVNIQGTLNVLEAARINHIKKVIFTSSSSVYGDQKKLPLNEMMVPQPLSPYALQKLTGERYCELYSRLYGLSSVVLRLFSVYGTRQNGDEEYATIIGKFLSLKKKGEPLPIYGDGNQERDFTHVDDVVFALVAAITIKNNYSLVNVCTGKSHSVKEICKLVGGNMVTKQVRSGESKHIRGSNRKARQLLHWKPKIDIKQGLLLC